MPMNFPVPQVDLTAILAGESDTVAAGLIDTACRESGFFYIYGHGLDEQISRAWDVTRWFFNLPLAAKQEVARSERNSRGFYNQELTKNTRDMKEVFDFGTGGESQDGWNLWPQAEGSASFRGTLTEYFNACQDVALRLLEVITQNLGASPDTLTAAFTPLHSSFLRLNYYPVEDPLTGTDGQGLAADTGHMGVHHHTDAGALTLLLQDTVGGLEIQHADAWIPVAPIAGTLVVNIGDIVQVWSNDRYHAPLHRVVASTRSDRYSLPYFFNPTYESTYAPLTEQTGPRRPPYYTPIHWGHFRHERQHGDYGDYGKEIQISDFRVDAGNRR